MKPQQLLFSCSLVIFLGCGGGGQVAPEAAHADGGYEGDSSKVTLPADGGLTLIPREKLLLLESVATKHATGVWGKEIAVGEPLTIEAEDGEHGLMAFPVALGTTQAPDLAQLREHFVQESRPLLNSRLTLQDLRKSQDYQSYRTAITPRLRQYGTIYVSMSQENYPVVRVAHELHPYFYQAHLAQQAVANQTGSSAEVLGIELVEPAYEYLVIESAGQRVLVHLPTLLSSEEIMAAAQSHDDKRSRPSPRTENEPEENEAARDEMQKEIAGLWERYNG
ncbi:MAG: hypothetical protein JRH20_31440, partial [Deltaproteobacteria bacterium]|nr:hypothetical protein [Deltaproteobacteria bacterium]